ncbi:MAG: RDD family protein [Campylobacter sp.]|uniref:RDD family protein n=1 Tax=Campylobacter sp. TaxID=205 RepID=UPI002975DE31|nr:RDD family protein [Campylobacter sp.]MDD7600404.1 RDD family protein [Campylobacteraceae bacterium]MCI6298665.1 RDD family protein [Campylobacter sp.]MCI6660749.1 RDD family protein [Campylobacter sp.]MCI7076644.1 RDD family protein [Campylobacter sp.]MCI7103086.1 RDD family protein [Campylobacter sp.]
MNKTKSTQNSPKSSQKAKPAPLILRFKAFIIDMFLIAAPLLYFTAYVVLNGKDDFQQNQLAIFVLWAVFGLIQSLFFAKTAASPGYKAQGIYAVDSSGKKAAFHQYLLRYICFVMLFVVGGTIIAFFRKDKRALHDIISRTIVVIKTEQKS